MQKGNPFLVNFSTAGLESKSNEFYLQLLAPSGNYNYKQLKEWEYGPRLIGKGVSIVGRSRFQNHGHDLGPEHHADHYISFLFDPCCAKLACRITNIDGDLYIENLAKKNPTCVAKSLEKSVYEIVTGRVKLEVGNVIQVGQSILKVKNHGLDTED